MSNALMRAVAPEVDLLNEALFFQLEFVRHEAEHYTTVGAAIAERVGDDRTATQMPHEWGSMDSYDDIRNSLWVALEIADNLLFSGSLHEQREFLRHTIADRGVCATDARVIELAWPGQPSTWLDEIERYQS